MKNVTKLIHFEGRIEAHFWVEEGEAPTVSNIMLNSYARVIGAVRSQGGNKSIMIYKIDSVKGINEVNTHYLEVLNARYIAEEFAKVRNTAMSADYDLLTSIFLRMVATITK